MNGVAELWGHGIAPGWVAGAAAIFWLAGTVKGVVGLGLPTVAMALLAMLVPPAQAAALLVVPSLVTNVWQMRPWPAVWPLVRRLGGMQCGICLGTWLYAWWLGAPAGPGSRLALGLALALYGAWGLTGTRRVLPLPAQGWQGPLVGFATGAIAAATGVFVVPAVPYLQALGLQRDALVQAMGLSFTVSTLALAAGLAFNASYPVATVGLSVVMLLPALAGMACGQWLRARMSPVWFRRSLMLGLLALGVAMVVDVLAWHGFASR